MISRREFLGTSLGAGVSLALTPELLLRALQPSGGKLTQRAIPSSGEMLPVVSFGARSADPAVLKEILKTLLDNGHRMVDVLHAGPAVEQGARTAADELGLQNKFFWTTILASAPPTLGSAGSSKADAAALRVSLEAKLATFKVPKIDLVMVSAAAAVDDPAYLAVLQEMKKEGRVRYIGVHELLFPPDAPVPYPPTSKLEAVIRNEPIDFIGADYHVGDRRLEEKVLPLAQERKIAAMAYFALDRGRLFKRAGDTPLPEWAADFGAKTWAQFFLKYVLSHPAITVARTGTTNPAHMLENIEAGSGLLPDEATRKRMAQLVDSFPP